MSYEFHKNELTDGVTYTRLLWKEVQKARRSPHKPANKEELIDRMLVELYNTGYAGGDNIETFSTSVRAFLESPDEAAALNNAIVYYSTP